MALPVPDSAWSISVRDEPGSEPPAEGTPVLVCFPSAGLASTIVGHYVINKLALPRCASVRSPLLPSISVIIEGLPHPPVRIHGNRQLAVVVSEFPPPPSLLTFLAQSLLEWAERRKAGPVYVVEGILRHEDGPEAETATAQVSAIPSNPAARALLEAARISALTEGVVGGLSADLLNESALFARPLSVIFTSTQSSDYPDHRGAAHLLEALDRLVEGLKIDPGPLLEQAEILERSIKGNLKMPKGRQPEEKAPPALPGEPSMFG